MTMQYPYFDMHCDTLTGAAIFPDRNLWDCPSAMVDVRRMHEAGQMAQFFAVFFPPREWLKTSDEEHYAKCLATLRDCLAAHGDVLAQATGAAQVRENAAAGKASAILTLEDGRIVDGKLERLAQLRADGVTAIALTWNGENCFGTPNSRDEAQMARGLTEFGRAAVGEMNRLGILIDVSHLSDGGFADVAALTQKPFIASHSDCRALCDHPRNLTDAMIRTLAEHGGVAGLNFCPEFLREGAKHAALADLTAHVMHLYRIGGEDVIALGTDFDGIDGTFDVGSPLEMHRLFESLAQAGLTPRQLEKFASGNVLRVLESL